MNKSWLVDVMQRVVPRVVVASVMALLALLLGAPLWGAFVAGVAGMAVVAADARQ